MISMMTQQEIMSFECELTGYRKGSLTVRVNLACGTMTWKDSRQWCNNFVRTLTTEQADELRAMISVLVPAETAPAAEASPSASDHDSLLLTVSGAETRIVLTRAQLDPSAWQHLRRSIEKLSRAPFRL